MRIPVRSEADAFRAVLWVLAFVSVIALASAAAGTWVAVGVFACLALVGIAWLGHGRASDPPPRAVVTRSERGERRILVVANETLAGDAVHVAVRLAATPLPTRVHVVCPALNSRLSHWVSDEDRAISAAERRLRQSLERLRAAGVTATGEVGDSDPLQAIEDALRAERVDAIVISTHPAGRSNWLERDVVERAAQRFGLPVTHVVVDLGSPPVDPPAALVTTGQRRPQRTSTSLDE